MYSRFVIILCVALLSRVQICAAIPGLASVNNLRRLANVGESDALEGCPDPPHLCWNWGTKCAYVQRSWQYDCDDADDDARCRMEAYDTEYELDEYYFMLRLDDDLYYNYTTAYANYQVAIYPSYYEGIDIRLVNMRHCGIKMTIIPEGSFQNNRIHRVTISPHITHIYENAFRSNRIDKLRIPVSVEYVGNNAFSNNWLDKHGVCYEGESPPLYIGQSAFGTTCLNSCSVPLCKQASNYIYLSFAFGIPMLLLIWAQDEQLNNW